VSDYESSKQIISTSFVSLVKEFNGHVVYSS